MRAKATLRLDDGETLRVEVDPADLGRDEIVVRRAAGDAPAVGGGLAATLRAHIATATPHPAGTADRLIEEDRSRRA